ncbi:MAG: PAAR domain-containing protein [Myxococcota bacterium]
MKPQARAGDTASTQADSHGCPACPHSTTGPAVQGSTDVLINALSAVRVQDQGMHAACCGGNTWKVVSGSSSVFINGKPAARQGDTTQHCGGAGRLSQGSPDVLVGG